ncbi:hypothetical protein O181_005715 [Austropuccinia psidii MF-1]|uniref:Uncharacterized protein n=1 Tax=Austropuccinia psidii MF-1 TaxID=1389203 RepID=A0A9Q3GG42_9BASI|nr:hypothetical protein [Austropuccinia psidii MF-1]
MDWQRVVYDGNLQSYIHNCHKMIIKLEVVNIVIPKDLFSFSLSGKLADNSDLHQFNEDILKKPEEMLVCFQDSVFLPRKNRKTPNPSALVSATEEPYKMIYYFKNGRHNNKLTTHKKDECWVENPHIRPTRNDKKRKFKKNSTHISIAESLINTIHNVKLERSQLILYYSATLHTSIPKDRLLIN